jgi:hypothetical protein
MLPWAYSIFKNINQPSRNKFLGLMLLSSLYASLKVKLKEYTSVGE